MNIRSIICMIFLAAISYGQVEVKLKVKDPNDRTWANLAVSVKNVGDLPIVKPKARFLLSVPSGKIPYVSAWNKGGVSISSEKMTETLWAIWFSLDGNLDEGKYWNWESGVEIGVRLDGFQTWDYTQSPSFDGNDGTMKINRKIKVWDESGRLIWGDISEMQTPVAPSGESSLSVSMGAGGRCNVLGTVYLAPTDRVDFFCQEDHSHLRPQVWVDGLLQPVDKYPTILPDGKDHSIQVSFPAKPKFTTTLNSTGDGNCVPSGVISTFANETLWVSCAAKDGSYLKKLIVDGVETPAVQLLMIPNVRKDVNVNAVFERYQTASPSLAIVAKKMATGSPTQVSYQLKIKNIGTVQLMSGWNVNIPIRVPEGVIPTVGDWGLHGMKAKLTEKGADWWLLTLTSTTVLNVGEDFGFGNGATFGLWYTKVYDVNGVSNINWDASSDVVLPKLSGELVSVPNVRAYSAEEQWLHGREIQMDYRRSFDGKIEVLYSGAEAVEMSRPIILLKNTGATTLSNFSYEYYFCSEKGRIPKLENWNGYTSDLRVFALGGHCYAVRYNYPTAIVGGGNSFAYQPGSGIGLHYSDYKPWSYTNDWSHNYSLTPAVQHQNPRIPVFDRWGNLIYGMQWTDAGSPGYNSGASSANGGTGSTTVDGSASQTSDLVKVKDIPVIVRQPQDVTVEEDSATFFEVRAIANGTDLRYQWRLNGINLIGATSPVLRLDRVSASQNGDLLSCYISTSSGFVVSEQAKISVKIRPLQLKIIVQPSDDTVNIGSIGRFEVFASGTGPLLYQWFKGAQKIPNAHSSQLAVPLASPSDTNKYYWVEIRDVNGAKIHSTQVRMILRTTGLGALHLSISGQFSTQETLNFDAADLRFRLYSTLEAGNPLWEEVHRAVPLKNGEWQVELGEFDPTALARSVSSQSTLYLETVLDGGIPRVLGPRMALTTVPFSLYGGKRMMIGRGAPTRNDLPTGMIWMDADQQKTWIRDVSEWKVLE